MVKMARCEIFSICNSGSSANFITINNKTKQKKRNYFTSLTWSDVSVINDLDQSLLILFCKSFEY